MKNETDFKAQSGMFDAESSWPSLEHDDWAERYAKELRKD